MVAQLLVPGQRKTFHLSISSTRGPLISQETRRARSPSGAAGGADVDVTFAPIVLGVGTFAQIFLASQTLRSCATCV